MFSGTFDIQTMFAGGRLCLDFINTACQRRETALEFLGSVEELRGWLQNAEEISGRPLCDPEHTWDTAYGERMLSAALTLRSALREMVQSVIDHQPLPASALETVNAILRANPTYMRLESHAEGFRKTVAADPPAEKWLAAIAEDAVELLCNADLALLKQCEYPTCIRVFYDTTKNHKRRWCVEKCGSHSKAAAYYRRKVAKSRPNHESKAEGFSPAARS